jgi:uncharacterized protein (TIGR03437 family)
MRVALFFAACSLWGQLIPSGQPIPPSPNPPVIFLNGFELNCGGASFGGTFGIADQILQNAGRASVFFNYCTTSAANSSIEDLGAAFGAFLDGLKYTNGQPVTQVDCVAYSMGGLILRSYLSGKQTASRTFQPPAAIKVRKAVFLATPNFGTGVPAGLPFSTTMVGELTSGSQFLFDLGTWNQGTDDLNGVDAVAAAGNGGTGLATTTGFDDGLVALTSASLGFYAPGRTRVVPYCHTNGGGLLSTFGYCGSNVKGIAYMDSASHESAQIMVSFLNGTSDWQNVGTAAEQDALLGSNGGLDVEMRNSTDANIAIGGVVAESAAQMKSLNTAPAAYTDKFAAGMVTLTGISGMTRADASVNLPGTVYKAVVLKQGPVIEGIAPSASAVFPLGAAPGELISIYGTGLSNGQVTISGATAQVVSTSDTLIDAIVPDTASGFSTLTVQNGAGQNSVNLWVVAAVPAVFTANESGSGAAAAVDATTGVVVDATHPLRAGDYLELFLTGLGATNRVNGLDVAQHQPVVTIAGKNCAVSYAGRAPGIAGVDQINCVVPNLAGPQTAAEVVVSSVNRVSNATTVSIQ